VVPYFNERADESSRVLFSAAKWPKKSRLISEYLDTPRRQFGNDENGLTSVACQCSPLRPFCCTNDLSAQLDITNDLSSSNKDSDCTGMTSVGSHNDKRQGDDFCPQYVNNNAKRTSEKYQQNIFPGSVRNTVIKVGTTVSTLQEYMTDKEYELYCKEFGCASDDLLRPELISHAITKRWNSRICMETYCRQTAHNKYSFVACGMQNCV